MYQRYRATPPAPTGKQAAKPTQHTTNSFTAKPAQTTANTAKTAQSTASSCAAKTVSRSPLASLVDSGDALVLLILLLLLSEGNPESGSLILTLSIFLLLR